MEIEEARFDIIEEDVNENFSPDEKSEDSPISESKYQESCFSEHDDQGNQNDGKEEYQNVEFKLE